MKCSPLGLLLGTAAAFHLSLPEPAYIQKTDGSLSKESGAYPPCGGGSLLGAFSDYPHAGSPFSVTTDLNECIWALRAFHAGESDKDLATLKYIWQTGAGSLCIPWLPDTGKLLGSFPDGAESTFSVYQLSKDGRYQYQCAMVYFRESLPRGDVPASCSNSTGVQARFIEFDEIEDFRNPSKHSSASATSSSMTPTSSSSASSTSSSESPTASSSSPTTSSLSTSSTESSSAASTSSSAHSTELSSSPPPITLTSLVTSVAIAVPQPSPSTAEAPVIATTTVTSPSQPPSISATALSGSDDAGGSEQDRRNFVVVTVLASVFGTILLISLCCCGCCFFRGGCGDWSYALASRIGLELPRTTSRTAPTTRVAAPDVEPGLPFNITVNNKN